VVNENVSLVVSRQILTDFCSHLNKLPDQEAKDVSHYTLEKIQPRVISFEEQVSKTFPTYLKWCNDQGDGDAIYILHVCTN
jgi:hypothetical protein